ncbi:MAG: YjbE family putative metal transport protein [Aestuariivirgaceae bacterium]
MHFFLGDMFHLTFWIAVARIIGVNIILSGDNAVVIALACMMLPPRQRLWGMILGAGVAVMLRVFFTLVVAEAMSFPYLKLVGGLLLFWVAVKLVVEDEAGEGKVEAAENLWRAVRIIAIADIVMSLDNVIAIAAAAETAVAGIDAVHQVSTKAMLIISGLASSVPLIVAGSALLMALLKRYRILIWAGGALLGWVAGDIMATDPAIAGWTGAAASHMLGLWAGRAGAAIVVGLGLLLLPRQRSLMLEDLLAGAGLAIWLAGDIAIDALFEEDDLLKNWLSRGIIALMLAIGYVTMRSRRKIGREEV